MEGVECLRPTPLAQQNLAQVIERVGDVAPIALVSKDAQYPPVFRFSRRPITQVGPQQTTHHARPGLGQPVEGLADQKPPQALAMVHPPGLASGFELIEPGPQIRLPAAISQAQMQVLQQEIKIVQQVSFALHNHNNASSASSLSIRASRLLSANSCATARALLK